MKILSWADLALTAVALAALLLALLSRSFPALAEPTAAVADVPKPNLILIVMDDMGYGDIHPFNPQTKNRTPNLDRMANEGMKFTSFYAAPLCTPSRAQFLTGCYAKRVSLGQVLFPASPVGLSHRERTIASLLKERGYSTLCVGKWHVGDQPEFLPTRYGFDHYFGLPYSNDMGGEWDGAENMHKCGRKPPLPLVRDERVIERLKPLDQDRLTERYTDEAVRFIRDHKDSPFFLYLAHTAVHVPLHPGHKFQGCSANGTYGDWVEEADDSVGRVLDAVREMHLEENTMVVFTSDNGPWLTMGTQGGEAGPLRGGKGSTLEGGVREPTIIWQPGKIAPGSTCDTVAGNIDLMPTFVHLAGGNVPDDLKIDGADITPLLYGKSKESPRPAHFYFNGDRLEAVRSGPWKLALAPQRELNGKPCPTETGTFRAKLYNLDSDIGEASDVADEHPEVVKRLQKFATEMDSDLGTMKRGPGMRPAGRVIKPRPLLLY
jgi:arylsulfatase A